MEVRHRGRSWRYYRLTSITDPSYDRDVTPPHPAAEAGAIYVYIDP